MTVRIIALITLIAAPVLWAQQEPSGAQALIDSAEEEFKRSNYEGAEPLVTQAISALQAQPLDEAARVLLVSAYSLRARARVGTGATNEAEDDFGALLRLDADYQLPEGSSSRYEDVFERVRQRILGQVILEVSPDGAGLTISIDGRRLVDRRAFVLTEGTHELTVGRPGFEPSIQTITVRAGGSTAVAVSLKKTSASIRVAASASGVEVAVDGEVRGVTSPTEPLVITGLLAGDHTLELRKPCYQSETRSQTISAELEDWDAGLITLARSVGALNVEADDADVSVWLEGPGLERRRVDARQPIGDLCDGEYRITVASRSGRFADLVVVEPGRETTVTPLLTPAFAILGREGPEMGRAARADTGPAGPVTVFVPTSGELDSALKLTGLAPDRFAQGGRPHDWKAVSAASQGLADALGAQGLAFVEDDSGSAVRVRLLAAAAVMPDPALTVASDTLAFPGLSLVPPGLLRGMLPVELIDTPAQQGPLVMAVWPGPESEAFALGDRIISLDGETVSNDAAYRKLLRDKDAGSVARLRLVSAQGATKQVSVELQAEPDLIRWDDTSQPFNAWLVQYRARLAKATDTSSRQLLRAHLGVALMGTGAWEAALAELRQTTLPSRSGVGEGTIRFLIGVCLKKLGRFDEAREAFQQAASSSESRMSAGGDFVSARAAAHLADLDRLR